MSGSLGNWSLGGPSGLATASLPSSLGLPLCSYSAVVLGDILIITGTGDPIGKCPAPEGSMFLRTDGGAGTSLYVKESGGADPTDTSGWAAK